MQKDVLQELEQRGFINQCSNMDGLKQALKKGKVTVYWGTDPTADSLHVGHVASLMLLRWFQKYGHKPIALVGGATARIGDPSGRDKGRPMMTDEQIAINSAGLRKSIAKFVDFNDSENGAIMVDNYDWMKNYGHIDFLAQYGTDFTVPRMLSMESVKKRLENGMTFLEFNYMTFQAVDYLTLYNKYNCTVQLCGADQWGNSVIGIDLIRKKCGKEVFVLSTNLITDANGNKIGKSAGNAVWVNEDKASPYEYYQYFRNTPDDLVITFLKIFTEIPVEEIEKWSSLQGAELNEVKKHLAFAATEIAHGTKAAQEAEATAAALFSGGNSADAPSFDLKMRDPMSIVDFLVAVKLFDSKSEARRMVEQGGIQIDGEKITDKEYVVKPAESIMVQRGKKVFLKVNIKK